MNADEHRWGLLARLLVVWSDIWLAPIALAQPQPPISPQEVQDQIARLGVNEEGEARIEQIHAEFVQQFMEIHEATQSIYRWLLPASNLHPGGMGEYHILTAGDYDRLSTRELLNWAQLEDLYFVQLHEAFPEAGTTVDWLARSHLRRRSLARTDSPNRTSGTPDPIQLTEWVLDGEDPYQNVELAAALNAFDLEMDAALRAKRQDNLESLHESVAELIASGDRAELVRLYEERYLPLGRIRRIAEDHLPRIAVHLPPDRKAALEAKFDHMLFADLYLPTRVDVLLERALKREDLTDSERGRLASIAEALERDRASERERLKQMAMARNSEAGMRKWVAHLAEMQLTGQGSRMMPEDIQYHNELVPAYRAIGSEYEEEILRILDEEGE